MTAALQVALSATWPADHAERLGPLLLRRSPGGGSRVQAATLEAAAGPDLPRHVDAAEARMRAWGQTPRFRIPADRPGLDAPLAARGYAIADPTLLLAAPVGAFAGIALPRLTAFALWPPLAIMEEIWAEGGIGPDRRAVMGRAPAPRTAILARQSDRAAGAAFAAIHEGTVMVHAVEVRATLRRHGVAARIMAIAALWGQGAGAATLAVAVTQANAGALAFYDALGLAPAGGYHYRVRKDPA